MPTLAGYGLGPLLRLGAHQSRRTAEEMLGGVAKTEYFCREDAAEKLRGEASPYHYCEIRVVRESPAHQAKNAGERISDPFDDAKHRG